MAGNSALVFRQQGWITQAFSRIQASLNTLFNSNFFFLTALHVNSLFIHRNTTKLLIVKQLPRSEIEQEPDCYSLSKNRIPTDLQYYTNTFIHLPNTLSFQVITHDCKLNVISLQSKHYLIVASKVCGTEYWRRAVFMSPAQN